MHEVSIAEAILDLARRNVPDGAVLRSVRISAGPMRGIDRECMEWAWQSLGHDGVTLELVILPWKLKCTDCSRQWEKPDLEDRCQCGSSRVRPIGGDELQLTSIEVDDETDSINSDRSPSCKSKLSKMS
jgi:hydrogenase nickel incorporation protein HypA/HybF